MTYRWLNRFRNAAVAALSLTAAACTTLVPLGSNSSQWAAQLNSGDTVQITRADGSQQEMKLTAVEADALVGSNQRVAFAEIQQLARKQVDGTRTTLLVVGVLAVAAAASDSGGGDDDDGGY